MDYISVRDAAEKWNLTPRRVQVLCAGGKIKGAAMISDVWLIPKDAEKPPDRRWKVNRQEDKAKDTEGET